jgi:FAD/FMN-containing dehydrogenase/Fe-S oxidoreductase
MRSELVTLRRAADDWQGSELETSLRREVDGDVGFDRGTRALYATDASNYRQPPIGVVVPRTVDAAVAAVAVCAEHDVPVLPRGGGTSLAGQCCNHAVVIDCSRHLRRVEIDRERGLAHVQPGVILDSLLEAARACGWDFGPDPSTHDRCTVGGMLGNNSCGTHSVMSEFYGPGPRISDHVEELEVLTYDGTRLRAGATDALRLAAQRARGDRVAGIYDGLVVLRDRWGDAIRTGFPDLPRRVSGYNLPDLLDDNAFHVGRALVGSEATCVVILDATLRLSQRLPHRAIVVIGYPDVFEAADRVVAVRALRPVGCEALDDRLVDRVRARGKHRDALDMLPPGGGWLVVELGGATAVEARAQAEAAVRALGAHDARIFDDVRSMRRIWEIREAALAVTAMAPGEPDTWEGWEDAAVPPAALGAYLRAFDQLLRDHELAGALYGHFAQGCVHTRIDFELATDAGIARYRAFTEAAARLVVAHGGSLSGEHGDGQSRADLLGLQFAPAVMDAFRAFKAIWDPGNRMNPGKLVEPRSRTDDLRLQGYHPEPGAIELVHGDDGRDFAHAALRCVGVGKCRKREHGTMCPSYMVTQEERHSPRGRAHLLYEMLRGEVITDGWGSAEVAEALELCLACKACKTECPVGVDIASYKAEFYAHHYRHHRRPRHAWVFGWIHRWLALARLLPARIANWIARRPLVKRLAGIAPARELPQLAAGSFRRTFAARGAGARAILWPDTFNDAFYPEVLEAAADVLASAGHAVELPVRRLCCGRPLLEHGWIDATRALWRTTLDTLDAEIAAGVPVIVVEPSCAAMFRDELPALLPDDDRAHRLARLARPLDAHLVDRGWTPPSGAGAAVRLHHHCHQAAVLEPRVSSLLAAAGYRVDLVDSGCCGMAGGFGFQADKYELSVALAERALLPAVRAAEPDALIVTDGFSCREQLRQLGGIRALHTAEVLARLVVKSRPV